MLQLNENDRGIGIAIRLTPLAPYGVSASHKLLPSEICNLHWAKADEEGMVAFGCNVPIDIWKKGDITRLFLFTNFWSQRFLCETKVHDVLISNKAFIPTPEEIDPRYHVEQWKNQPQKTWFLLSDFRQLSIKDCPYKLLTKPNVYLRDQLEVTRFRSCFVNLNLSHM